MLYAILTLALIALDRLTRYGRSNGCSGATAVK